jgi:hypothetical protein
LIVQSMRNPIISRLLTAIRLSGCPVNTLVFA